MRRTILLCAVFLSLAAPGAGLSQERSPEIENRAADLFDTTAPLEFSLKASMKFLKRETNDSTYLEGTLRFRQGELSRDSIDLRVRARGDFRRSQCYFAPLKLEFRKPDIEGTLFEGHDELKLVLPCLIGAASDDYVLKEYLAYKLFEVVSPYYYRTRLVRMEYTELRGRREKDHQLLGFVIEDHGALAERLHGKRIRRNLPPQMQDPEASIRNNLFEYAIGNTDFSLRLQHNQRLYYIDEKYVSIPYDFDMSGLVNAPYATVSNIQTLDVQLSDVTERAYKGYTREAALVERVRRQFLDARPGMMRQLQTLEPYFKDPRQYREAEDYLQGFFGILEDDRKFEREVLSRMRE